MKPDPHASPQSSVAYGYGARTTHHGKQIAWIGIPLAMFAGGLLDHDFLIDSSPLRTSWDRLWSFTINVSVCIFAFLWYRQDAAERGFRRNLAWDIGIILFTAVFVLPWYLFKSRGAKGGMISLGWLLAFVVVGLVIPYFVGLILPHALQSP